MKLLTTYKWDSWDNSKLFYAPYHCLTGVGSRICPSHSPLYWIWSI